MKTKRKFDSLKINNYWKNQLPPTNLTERFKDPYFPPVKESLLGLDENGNFLDPKNGPIRMKDINAEELEWKSIPEIFGENYLLFENKIEFDDIKQGNLGNCYFLSAIAALTEFPLLIYQIFRSNEVNEFGYYEVVLFIDGDWQIVFIDDYFPVIKNTNELKFCRPNGNELWAMILEKAWAKVNGGYALIIAGWPSDPLVALTGFNCQKLYHQEETLENLWLDISKSDNDNCIMCTNTINNKDIEKLGLVLNHAYTLISAKETPDKRIQLIRVRNPWGYKEWCGKYSDNSELWTKELREHFSEVNKDDGTFYISIDDFQRFFSNTQICNIMYNCNSRVFHLSNELLQFPLFLIVKLDRDENCAFSLNFKHWRFNRNFIGATHPASIIIAKLNEENGKFTIYDFNGNFSAHDDVDFITKLSKGTYFVWMFIDLMNCYPYPEKATFRINSTSEYEVSYYGCDFDFKIIRKIFVEGLKTLYNDKITSSVGVYHHIDNCFRKTGIGYEMFVNKHADKTLLVECDVSKIEGLRILPPFHIINGKIQMMLRPKTSTIILAMRTDQKSHWMNISKNTKEVNSNEELMQYEEDLERENLKEILEQKINPIVDPKFYNYNTLSKEEILMKNLTFETINMKQATLLKYKNEYKQFFDVLLDYNPIENDADLIWSKIIFKNGFYLGETLNGIRQGRGAFIFEDGNYYIGYWNNNQRSIYGRIFNSKNKIIYRGHFSNGVKQGNGVQLFENGNRYEGEFVNDVKSGKGIFYFANGTRWEGSFKNNQLHGEGFLYSNDNTNKKLVKYENGKLI